MNYHNPQLVVETATVAPGRVIWRSPSNLAIVKYWGKHGLQLPRNPSISFTLSNAFTQTNLSYTPKKGTDEGLVVKMTYEGRPAPSFEARVLSFFEGLIDIFPFLRQFDMEIDTTNSFPHSAGIASSASGMSALALCLCDMERNLFGTLQEETEFRQKASYVARLGSGSACRSVFGGVAAWGQHAEIPGSSDLFAVDMNERTHEVFQSFHDAILIVSNQAKEISSTSGHSLMENHDYATVRYQQANNHIFRLTQALQQGDLEEFGRITEQEALTLHAMMMSSHKPYVLLKPATLAVYHALKGFRKDTDIPVFFSLDAGPNPHLLFPDEHAATVKTFIDDKLKPLCQGGQILYDKVGDGPLSF